MIHIVREPQDTVAYCDDHIGPETQRTCDVAEADCPECVDAWETEPQPLTTEHAVELLELIYQLARPLNDAVARYAADLRDQFLRPRKAPPLREPEKFPITPEQRAVYDAEVARLRAARAHPDTSTFGADGVLRRDSDGVEMGYYADGKLHPAPAGKP